MNESLIPRVEASDGGGLGAGEVESGLTTVIQFPACVPKEMVGGEGFHSIFPSGHGLEQETVDRLTAGAAMSEVSGGKYFSARVSTHGFRHRQS